VWLNAADRNEVTAAAHRIDLALGHDPLSAGESRDRGFRILYDGPLAAIYKIDSHGRRVIIVTVGPPLRAP
jgi:hypothetical protein